MSRTWLLTESRSTGFSTTSPARHDVPWPLDNRAGNRPLQRFRGLGGRARESSSHQSIGLQNTGEPAQLTARMLDVPTVHSEGQFRIVPANEAAWDDLQLILAGEGKGCQCQFFKLDDAEWHGAVGIPERSKRLRDQTKCGDAGAGSTSGLIAYSDGEPAGWCAVEPRSAYPRLLSMRVPWAGRNEDKSDDQVWAVTCFVVHTAYRRRGVARALAEAAVGFARQGGAQAVEGYPRVTIAGQEAGDVSLYVGSREIFAAAGYLEVSKPTPRRVVMRINF